MMALVWYKVNALEKGSVEYTVFHLVANSNGNTRGGLYGVKHLPRLFHLIF